MRFVSFGFLYLKLPTYQLRRRLSCFPFSFCAGNFSFCFSSISSQDYSIFGKIIDAHLSGSNCFRGVSPCDRRGVFCTDLVDIHCFVGFIWFVAALENKNTQNRRNIYFIWTLLFRRRGFWFFAYAAHLHILHFGPLIILLTAVHFHYSAFLIPIFNGLLGRVNREKRVMYGWVTWIILLSPLLIALGITYSKTLDILAVGIYMAALYLNSYLIFKTAFRSKTGKVLIRLSSVVLMITICFSFIYSFGVFRQEVTLTISQMIWIHGVVNAFGVILPALAGWRKENPQLSDASVKVFSRIYGKRTIGKNFCTTFTLKITFNIADLWMI